MVVIVHPAVAQSPWSGALSGGYATGLGNDDLGNGSFAVTGGVFRQIGRIAALGIEVGYQQYENRTEPKIIEPGSLKYKKSERHIAGLLRVRSSVGRWRPYAIGGLGVYAIRETFEETSDDFVAPGGQIGLGVELHPHGGALGIGLGARLHAAATVSENELVGAGILTIMLSLAYR
jgi:hypothetical protein